MAVVDVDFPIITLTTDFRHQDNYVGILKGILAGINPSARVIDITHEIPPFDILAGRYVLENSYLSFPAGTIHLAVVDPGVGTGRKAILIETNQYLFIGPDNGLFSFLKKSEIVRIISLKNRNYFFCNASATFHARDIFTPAAGFLSLGIDPGQFGPALDQIKRIRQPGFREVKDGLIASIIYVDRFGNLVSSIKADKLLSGKFEVFLNEVRVGTVKKTFGSVPEGKPVCYINSFGYLEIAINGGNACSFFHVDSSPNPKILIAPKDKAL